MPNLGRIIRIAASILFSCTAAAATAGEAPYIQFTLEGAGISKHTATFDVTGWSGTKHGVRGASKLDGAVSREGRRYSQVSLALDGEKPYLILGVFEDGTPVEGPGSNSLAMRSKPSKGVDAFLKVEPGVAEAKHATGKFSGVLVVTNRRSKSASDRTYQLTDGRYSLTATEKK